jgi:hypothetical protein
VFSYCVAPSTSFLLGTTHVPCDWAASWQVSRLVTQSVIRSSSLVQNCQNRTRCVGLASRGQVTSPGSSSPSGRHVFVFIARLLGRGVDGGAVAGVPGACVWSVRAIRGFERCLLRPRVPACLDPLFNSFARTVLFCFLDVLSSLTSRPPRPGPRGASPTASQPPPTWARGAYVEHGTMSRGRRLGGACIYRLARVTPQNIDAGPPLPLEARRT